MDHNVILNNTALDKRLTMERKEMERMEMDQYNKDRLSCKHETFDLIWCIFYKSY